MASSKWNPETQSFHKFQQFINWLQKICNLKWNLQPEIEINEYSSSKNYSSSTRVLEYSR